ncbi:MAG: hypothetical protein HY202_01825 [Nitrospirae bacterium]|nr:hypothetical protein [Nitrospirota bacterium]MBI3604746.1 hypothetical protein [Nitrospirota bacterium]
MFYQDVFKAFDKRKIKYVVIGGIAINLHGAPRMTSDLDILADLNKENLSLLLETLKELGYCPRLPVSPMELLDPRIREEWKKEKNLKAFTFYHPKIQYQEVDLLLESPLSFDEINREKTIVEAESTHIPVISIEHLIEMKRRTGREQDEADVQVLEKIRKIESREKKNG